MFVHAVFSTYPMHEKIYLKILTCDAVKKYETSFYFVGGDSRGADRKISLN